ncbi:MAG: TolC family protein [Gemmatimonadetes bacterium]|nr:TolC family protein [Gemmatimonadota bacterium]
MKMTAWRVVFCSIFLALGAVRGVDAQQPGAAPEDSYQVGSAEPPADPSKPLLRLTLEEAVDRALQNNLDLQTARLNPEIQRYAGVSADAAFSPTIGGNVGYNNSSNQSTSQLDGGTRTTTQRSSFNLSLSQTLPWYGGRLSTNFNNSRTSTDNSFATRNPSFSSSVSLSYTQPLLSGFRTDNQRTALETQEIQRQITDIQLVGEIENIANQVRVSYWALRSAIEQIEIQRRGLEQAQQLLENNRLRVQLGTLAEIELVQADAQVASAEQTLLNAEIQWRTQDLSFKRLLVGGPDDALFGQTIFPVDVPAIEEVQVDIQAAIDGALQSRTDIRQQREQQQISLLNLDVTRENALPDLNLTASYSLQGVGGDLFARSGLGGTPQFVQQGGYVDGLSSIAGFDTPSLNLSLNFTYPIGMRSGRANVERAQIQLRQAEIALQGQELAIATEVTSAGLAVENTFLQLEAARRSQEAAERSTDAELARFAVGASTNFQVVSSQNSLTSARLSEIRAAINYTNAIAEFDRVQRVGR